MKPLTLGLVLFFVSGAAWTATPRCGVVAIDATTAVSEEECVRGRVERPRGRGEVIGHNVGSKTPGDER